MLGGSRSDYVTVTTVIALYRIHRSIRRTANKIRADFIFGREARNSQNRVGRIPCQRGNIYLQTDQQIILQLLRSFAGKRGAGGVGGGQIRAITSPPALESRLFSPTLPVPPPLVSVYFIHKLYSRVARKSN